MYKRDLYTGWRKVKIVEVEMGGEGRREKGFLRRIPIGTEMKIADPLYVCVF